MTNLDAPDEQIINYYHQLWHVEQSFRMSKSDLKARPIFHHLKDSIEAHLTVVMAALAMGKIIEQRTSLSTKKFIKILRPIRNSTVLVGEKIYEADAVISPEMKLLLDNLNPAH